MKENELLEAIGKMMDERLKPIQEDIASIKEDIEDLKEQSEIANSALNILIEWAENVSEVNSFPLPRLGA